MGQSEGLASLAGHHGVPLSMTKRSVEVQSRLRWSSHPSTVKKGFLVPHTGGLPPPRNCLGTIALLILAPKHVHSAASVESMFPRYGSSTSSSTRLELVGSGLSTGVLTVNLIDKLGLGRASVLCDPNSQDVADSSDTKYHCTLPAQTAGPAYHVEVTGATVLPSDMQFQYFDLWSSPSTWPLNAVPSPNDNATISGSNKYVLLDIPSPPQLYSLMVTNGATLSLLDPDEYPPDLQGSALDLKVTHFHVHNGAHLIAGTPSRPLKGRVVITLVGTRSTPELPEMMHGPEAGAKALFVHDGSIDLHGTRRVPTWTKLAQTAQANSNSLVVRGNLDWKAGESVAVSSSGFDVQSFSEQFEAQQCTVSSVTYDPSSDTTTIGLIESLNYMHYGEVQCWGPNGEHCVDTTAEVILLSRNVLIQGDDSSTTDDGFGGHLKMHNSASSGTASRVSHVEFYRMGQRHLISKYPVHFHVPGDASGSYAEGNSIHESYNRAVTVHGAQGMLIKRNVAFEIEGHSFYLEDGTESGNVFEENVVFNTRQGSVISTDGSPASFYIKNPNNTFKGNVAAGSFYAGFWIHPDKTADGDDTICPRYLPLPEGGFVNNVAHSNKKYGVEIERWVPKDGCSDSSNDIPAVLKDTTIFKNGYDGFKFVGHKGCGAIILDGVYAADNARTYQTSATIFWDSVNPTTATGNSGVRNCVLAHVSDNDPFHREPLTAPVRRGFHLPVSDNVFVEDCVFVNYYQEGWVFDPNRTPKAGEPRKYGFEVPTRRLTFIDSPNRVHFRFPHHGIVQDLDGTLTETGVPSAVVANSSLYDPAHCHDAPPYIATTAEAEGTEYNVLFHSVPLLVCDVQNGPPIRRWGHGEFIPEPTDGPEALQTWSVSGSGQSEDVVSYAKDGRYTLASPSNSIIDVHFKDEHLPDEWLQQATGRYYTDPDEYIHFRFHLENRPLSSFAVFLDGTVAPLLSGIPGNAGSSLEPGYFLAQDYVLHVLFKGARVLFLQFGWIYPTTSPPPPAPSTTTASPLPTTTTTTTAGPPTTTAVSVDGAACPAGYTPPPMPAAGGGSVLAFPGADGFGRNSKGGRGGVVLRVTTLSDSGPGSFREAVETSSGPRTVVFDVSGYIDLASQVTITNGLVTIAGQTSPGGITLRGSRLKVKASDVIVRGMRFRPGGIAGGDGNCNDQDGFGVGTSVEITDVVFDHCSATWALDENGSSWYSSTRTTVSNCLFGEAIRDKCGTAGFGYLVGTGDGRAAPTDISLLRNAFFSNADRNPVIKDGATRIELINNLGYNWKSRGLGVSGSASASAVNAINNVYLHGPRTIDREAFYLQNLDTQDSIYLSGNVDNCYRPDATRGAETDVAHKESDGAVAAAEVASSPTFLGSGAAVVGSDRVQSHVLANVGAVHPVRDPIDAAILATLTTDAGHTQTCGGGDGEAFVVNLGAGDFRTEHGTYPAVSDVAAPLPDSDGDGIPDCVEDAWSRNRNAADSHEVSPTGYTWLEDYINSFYPEGGQSGVPLPSTTTALPSLLDDGAPCNSGMECKNGFCGGMANTLCMTLPQNCAT